MAGQPGIWILYRKTFVPEKGTEYNAIGRFVIHGGNITVMEDQDKIIERIFPTGPITEQELNRMKSMENAQSPYWELVREKDE